LLQIVLSLDRLRAPVRIDASDRTVAVAAVVRTFRTDGGGTTTLTVPGSFYEFTSRDAIVGPDGSRQLDLRFDSMNAQGIFKMTAVA
jgi:hypothetical protein